jgi:pSer/pThr/pTyr-binding forkhead associated (FHA) protein
VGETLPLQALTVLERTAENSIVVRDDPVTAAQTRLRQENGVWWLEDLGSDTLLNELPLSKPTPLTEGDIIGIGSLRFKLESSR